MPRILLASIAALTFACTSAEAADLLKVMTAGDACPAGGVFQSFGDPGINSQVDVLFWSQSSLGVNGLYLDLADVPGAQVLVTEGQYLEPLGTIFCLASAGTGQRPHVRLASDRKGGVDHGEAYKATEVHGGRESSDPPPAPVGAGSDI